MSMRLAADEVIELGRDRKAVPVFAIRGVFDAWMAKLDGSVSELAALEDHLGRDGDFLAWGAGLAGNRDLLAQANLGERWEAVRRTSYELLGAAQAFALACGPYLSPEEEESLGMAMDRALAAIDRAQKEAKPLRVGLRAAVDLLAHHAALDLNQASVQLEGILPRGVR